MRVIQLCGVNLAKPSLPAVECQYQTIAWLSANPASANFRFGSKAVMRRGGTRSPDSSPKKSRNSLETGPSRPDHPIHRRAKPSVSEL